MDLKDAEIALRSIAALAYQLAEKFEASRDQQEVARAALDSIEKQKKRSKKKVAKPAKKKPTKRDARGVETYRVEASKRGRVPSWVLKATGLANKQEVINKYGDGYEFHEGMAPVPKKGT